MLHLVYSRKNYLSDVLTDFNSALCPQLVRVFFMSKRKFKELKTKIYIFCVNKRIIIYDWNQM